MTHGEGLNVRKREWATVKMLLDQSKVDRGRGGKDGINRFKS